VPGRNKIWICLQSACQRLWQRLISDSWYSRNEHPSLAAGFCLSSLDNNDQGNTGYIMTKNLRERAEETAKDVQSILGISNDDHPKEVADAIEQAIIKALVDERHRCADLALVCCAEDGDRAQRVADEIRKVRSVLITNLSAMR
jgi:hypothetical protein